MAAKPKSPPASDDPTSVAAYWLLGRGQARAAAARSACATSHAWQRRARLRRFALPAYLGAIGAGHGCDRRLAAAAAQRRARSGHARRGSAALAALLMLFPASEAAVAVINRLISESARPSHLPRLAFATGIPPEHRPMVVIPAMLTGPQSGPRARPRAAAALPRQPRAPRAVRAAHRLGRCAERALPGDGALLDAAVRARSSASMRSTPCGASEPPRFIVLHRGAHLRRTGAALDRLGAKARQAGAAARACSPRAGARPFIDLGRVSTRRRRDAATSHARQRHAPAARAPARAGRRRRASAQPAAARRPMAARVARGYGILQPHVATPLPRARGRHALPLAVRGPERHRPVQRRQLRGLPGRVRRRHLHRQGPARRRRRCTPCSAAACPTSQVLSHDLLEGSLARCAAVTDVTVIEDAPFHADVAASRVHRWTRGDWQLLPILLSRRAATRPARDQPLEDGRQPAPLAGRAGVARAWSLVGAGDRRGLALGGAGADRLRRSPPGR